MKKTVLLLMVPLLILCLESCEDGLMIDNDYKYELSGRIFDNLTGIPIDSVYLCRKSHNTPDSLIFFADSVNLNYPNGFEWESRTGTIGKYKMLWFLEARQSEMYNDVFAYKPGYKLWRFPGHNEQVIHLTVSRDSLDIILERK
jgi:hypothetical protein